MGAGELPLEFREKMTRLLGKDADDFFSALEAERTGLRVNTLRATADEAQDLLPFALEPLPFPPNGFLVGADERPGKHPYHAAGLYYLQDPAAMTVAALLDPQPGERIVDVAAAPGGKTTHLAALTGDTGFLLANEVNPARARELAGNLERCGVRNAAVAVESVDRLAEHFGSWFDRVLLDAPCSGEAMFCGSEAARAGWSDSAVQGCARRQSELLQQAAVLVRPGGRLIYSTCTFSPEEDEDVVALFLNARSDFELLVLPVVPGASPGRPDWAEAPDGRPELARTVRLWPHRFPGAGHFIAILRRTGGDESTLAPAPDVSPGSEERELFEAFHREALGESLQLGTLSARGAELFAVPPGAPDLSGLRLLRPGWWLGTFRTARFEPVHALAMGLHADGARTTIDLGDDERSIEAFLRGETLRIAGDPGWVLITTRGLPLGWGKRVGTTVKNHRPKGLRLV